MTTSQHLQRAVARVDSSPIERGMTAAHRVRPLVPPGSWGAADPFLLLMEDWFPLGVFDNHPHRGIETVTYVVEGSIEHYDNHGNTGTIGPGDALWLTAGRGIIHNERPGAGQIAHVLQLWVNLPRAHKLARPAFQELRGAEVPVRREPGAELRVFSGASGSAVAQTHNYAQVLLVEVRLEPGAVVEQELPAGYNGFLVLLEGQGIVGSAATAVAAGQVAWLTPSDGPSTFGMRGGENGMRALLMAGLPLREPVVAQGPFVMNSREEIQQAYADFRRQGDQFGQ